MLHVHRATSAGTLVIALGELLAVPASDPFTAEVVAVPAKGVERWLAQRLSHTLGATAGGDGVCANVVFPSPARLLDGALTQVSPELAGDVEPWEPGRAVWPLLEVVDSCAGEPWCARLARHLAAGGRRYAVASRLAALFATYGQERPELVRSWAAGELGAVPSDLAWQVELWRRLRERIGAPSPAERLPAALARLRAEPGACDLPPRLSLFGATRLSTARLAVLAALADRRDVHVWLHHASPALWDAVASGRPATHPLLASMSADVQALQGRLTAAAPGHADRHLPGPPLPVTLLGRLQADLAADRVLPRSTRPMLDPADRSVVVHACHGRARQVEVLREAVLGLLAADPTLEPRDVLVMCPDVEEFAPLVAAAFGLDTGEGPAHPAARLRVRLADRALRQANPLMGTLAILLELARGRVGASAVLDLAASGPVRRRFRFDDDDLEHLREWVGDAKVSWGLDAADRARFSLGGLGQGTWRDGLDRLLLGVAMDSGEHWLGPTLPLDDVDSAGIDLAGRLAELVDRVAAALDALSRPRPVAEWAEILGDAVLGLAEPAPAQAWQEAALRAELADLRSSAAGSTVALEPADLDALLRDRLAGRPTRAGFRTGTLTVATMVPMRSVPHRVVVLLGLDEASFPRAGAADGDDLLARDPRPGERDPRAEDRQLLLDAVCAAQENLLVLYSGADERTGALVPPSVPLGELLDTLDATVRVAGNGRVRAEVTVRHPLQPFDPRNFAAGVGGRPGSFDQASLVAARALIGPRQALRPLAGSPLSDPEDADAGVALADLVRLLLHPARGFLRQRLGVAMPGDDSEPSDALPVALDGLAAWAIGERMLASRLLGTDVATCLELESRHGTLPPGALGHREAVRIGAAAERIATLARAEPATTTEPTGLDVDVLLGGGRRLTGTVTGVRGTTLLSVTYSTLSAKHRLRAWVELLALTAADPAREWRAVVVGKDGKGAKRSVLGPVDPALARAVLADLAALRDAGLREPLPIPLRTAATYAASRCRGMRPDNAERAAEREWTSEKMGERKDAEHVLLWGVDSPFETVTRARPRPADFLTGHQDGADGPEPHRLGVLAMRLWSPLLAAERLDSL